jgi:hypothetical protein
MTPIDRARAADAEDRPLDAIEAYESAVTDPMADESAFLDLAVLYFECLDFGYASAHKLPASLQEHAYERAMAVLDAAEGRFGKTVELEFWRRYIPFAALGDPPFDHDARMLFARGARTASFYLWSLTDDPKIAEAARAVLAEVAAGRTARERYVRGVLQSKVKPLT